MSNLNDTYRAGDVTTLALGEEDPITTLAIGEEDPYTTMAVGEEDKVSLESFNANSPFGAF